MSDTANQDPNLVENVRLTIAKQGSVEQGINGLLRAISNIVRDSLDRNDRTTLVSLAKSFDEDPKQWADAIQANTVAAALTAGTFAHVPTYVQDAFKVPGAGGWNEPPTAPPHGEVTADPATADQATDDSATTGRGRKSDK